MAPGASTFLDISNGGWSAIAAWVGLGLAVVGAIFASRQFNLAKQDRVDQAKEAERRRAERETDRAQQAKEAQQIREEEAQPYVVIYAEPAPGRPHVVELVVKNFGATVAKDISITVVPTLFRYAGGDGEAVEMPSLIRTLVPGQEWRTLWDATPGTTHLHMDHHIATVDFCDVRDRKLGPYTFVLDWSHITGRLWPSSPGMPELVKAGQEIRDLLKGWKATGNALRVHTYDGEAHDQRERESWEARRKANAQREAE